MTAIIMNMGQSGNGAAFPLGASLALATQYPRLAADGRIVKGRDLSGLQIPSTELAVSSRYNHQQSAGAGVRYGYEGACHDRLMARGSRPVLFVPHWRGGTNSAEWVANVATSPDTDTASALIQIARHKLRYALSMTDAVMGMFAIYQGESNATGTPGAGPVEWPVDWGSICDNLVTVVLALGSTFVHPTKRFAIVQLPETNPDPDTYPDWDAVRSAQADLVAARSDCELVPAPDGPYNDAPETPESVHLAYGTTASEGVRGIGTGVADCAIDAFGF